MAGIFWRVLLATSLIVSFWSAGNAAPVTGNAVAVAQSTTVTGDDGKRTLEAGKPVFVGERIKTGRTGQVQLIFTDDTKMVIGPNSSLVIEAYLLSSRSTVEKLAINALGGSFRFITGKSRKQAYSITTPTGTIGIRGTGLDLAVRSSFTDLVLLVGVAELCSAGGCVLEDKICGMVRAPRTGGAREVRSLKRRNRLIRARFPYIVSQRRLRREFQLPTTSCRDGNGDFLFPVRRNSNDENRESPGRGGRGQVP